MLSYLHVKNLALIEEEEIRFKEGLNILSGETGAGKSIILGALDLALGKKAGKEILRDPSRDALVEAVFTIGDETERKRLTNLGVEIYDDEVILTRKISENRASAKINGETVPAVKMREVGDIFLDIYGQNEHQTLLKKAAHLALLDEYGSESIAPKKAAVKEQYEIYRALRDELENAETDEGERAREASFLKHEIDEITAANIKEGEDEELEKRYDFLKNAERIAAGLSEAYALTGEEQAASQIGRAMQRLSGLSDYDAAIGDFEKTLADAESMLSDFNRAISDYLSEMEFDEAEFRELETRLDTLNLLKKKYGATLADVINAAEEKQKRLEKLESFDTYIAELSEKKRRAEDELKRLSDALHTARENAAEKLSAEMVAALSDLQFLDVRFSMEFSSLPDFSANGTDEGEFYIATNVGAPLRPLRDVASGGELSRIMLALKTVIADRDKMHTLIFDEIDAGISGRTAQAVSERLCLVAKGHQVICITHLPQIAAMADHHFLIEKAVVGDSTISSIRPLDEKDAINELARLLGGAEITDAVYENASEMKALAKRKKEAL